MFDIFLTPQVDALQESHEKMAAWTVAISQILVAKGICTDDEILTMQAQVITLWDQMRAADRDKAAAEAKV